MGDVHLRMLRTNHFTFLQKAMWELVRKGTSLDFADQLPPVAAPNLGRLKPFSEFNDPLMSKEGYARYQRTVSCKACSQFIAVTRNTPSGLKVATDRGYFLN